MTIRVNFQLNRGDFQLIADLEFPGRGITALFGPSGAGKTTLLRVIAGLEPIPGVLEVNGEVWQDSAKGVYVQVHKRALGFVFQNANLFEHLSVSCNIEYGLRRTPQTKRYIKQEHVVELLGLGQLLQRYPRHLSGGERQRVAIARALLTSPQLLLMDEPLASLDHARKREVLPYIERLRDEIDLPILYVSHAVDEIARLADYLVVLEQGRVLTCGTLAEVLVRFDIPMRLGEEAGVVLAGVVALHDSAWHLLKVACGAITVWVRHSGETVGQQVRLRVLARDISIALTPPSDVSIMNVLPAQVIEIGPDNHPALVLARLLLNDIVILARLTKRSAVMLDLQPGMSVWAQIKAAAVIS